MENQNDFIKKILIISAIACFASLFWNFIVPLVIAAGLIGYQFYLLNKKEDEIKQVINNHKYQIKELEDKVKELDTKERLEEISTLEKRLETLKSDIKDRQKQLQNVTNEYQNLNQTINIQKAAADSEINLELTKQKELIKKEAKKVSKFRELYKSIKYSINNFFEYDPSSELLTFKQEDLNLVDAYAPSVFLHLQYMNSKELRKAYRENDKQITKLMEQYSSRYTTKSNKAMYSLMVIALRSELQNILSDLKYGTIDKATDKIKEVTMKYLEIAGNGNQQIYGTLTKFIGQLEYLFINAAKIEYNYYVKKEKEKQEQLALKEKMRQEAAELKALEAEKKKATQKNFAEPIIAYLLKRCEEDQGLAEDVMQEGKTWNKCFNYIVEQARKQSNGRSTAVEDQVVYEWAEDYYHKYEKPETAKKEKDKKPATTKKTEAPAKKVTEIKKDIQETKNDSKVSEKPEKKDAASKQRKTEKTSTKSSGLNGQISLFDLL